MKTLRKLFSKTRSPSEQIPSQSTTYVVYEQVGKFFTEESYAKSLTEHIISYLNIGDLQLLCCTNRFCKEMCEREFTRITKQNLFQSSYSLRKIFKIEVDSWQRSYGSCSSDAIVFSFSDGIVHIINRATLKPVAEIKAEKYVGKCDQVQSYITNWYLEEKILVIAFCRCRVHKSTVETEETCWVFVNTLTGAITNIFPWKSTWKLGAFVYNSVTMTVTATAFDYHQGILIRWNVSTFEKTETTFSTKILLDMDSLLTWDKDNYFHSKESWSNNFVSKYKNILVWETEIIDVQKEYNVVGKTLHPSFTGPAIIPTFSEVPIYNLHSATKYRVLCELDYAGRKYGPRPLGYKLK